MASQAALMLGKIGVTIILFLFATWMFMHHSQFGSERVDNSAVNIHIQAPVKKVEKPATTMVEQSAAGGGLRTQQQQPLVKKVKTEVVRSGKELHSETAENDDGNTVTSLAEAEQLGSSGSGRNRTTTQMLHT